MVHILTRSPCPDNHLIPPTTHPPTTTTHINFTNLLLSPFPSCSPFPFPLLSTGLIYFL